MPTRTYWPAAILWGLSLAATGIAPTARADDLPRLITVAGTGSVDGAPDLARLSFAIERRNPDMRAARDGVVRVSRDFLALCSRLAIPERKVRTAGLSIQPEYRYDETGGPPVLVGYIVQRQLQVELNDLEKLGELIEGAIDAGVNQASPAELDSSQRAERMRDALAAAAEDARRNAERVATTLGARVGPVRQVTVGDTAPPPMPMPKGMVMAAEARSDAATYSPGEVRFEVRVSATFDLLAP
jgi:uncharacterized protein YggE